jgi:hypothetical protein
MIGEEGYGNLNRPAIHRKWIDEGKLTEEESDRLMEKAMIEDSMAEDQREKEEWQKL